MSELILAGGNAIDARGERAGLVDIAVTAGRIRSITPAADRPSHTTGTAIDCRGLTVVPGLVNMHEHLCGAHPGLEQQSISDEGQIGCAIRMAGNAIKGLRAGVTTMRLVGEKDGLEFRVRDAIEAQLIDGPRVYTAGSAFDFRGGHGWVVRSLEGHTPDQYRELASEQIGLGVDLLKVMISESGSSPDRDDVKMSLEDFNAIRGVARKAGLRMAVHTAATKHAIIDQIIDDSVDSLEHCYSIPDQLLQKAVSKRLLLVMTPLVCRASEYFEAIELPEEMLAGLEQMSETHWSAVKRAVASGATLALGTDIHSHIRIDDTWAVVKELELYEEAGATPGMLLEIASRNGASWLGQQEELGLIEEGYLADLLILDKNPLCQGASAFREVRHIVAGGTVVEPRAPEPPRAFLDRPRAPTAA